MATQVTGPYLGVNNVARKIHKMFLGVDGVSRKVRKCYVGDENGKAQLWFEGLPDNLQYTLAQSSSLNWNKYGMTRTEKYAVMGGGLLNDDYTSTAMAFEKTTLTASFLTSLSSARAGVVGASTGKTAFLASGHTSSSRYKSTFYYNQNLTMGSFDLSTNHSIGSGARAGTYALIAGGENRNTLTSTVCTETVEAINDSVTKTSATSLPTGVSAAGSGQMGDKAVFAGGSTGSSSSTTTGTNKVAVYDGNLTQTVFPDMSLARVCCGVTGNDKLLIIAGTGEKNPSTYEMYSAEGTKMGTSYSMYYGGWLSAGAVNVETDAYPDGGLFFANMSCILGFDGKDGTLALQKATGLNSDAVSYYRMGVADFGDEVVIPLLANGDKIAQFKAMDI